MARLRVGIVGVGRIADLHARGYSKDKRAEIIAVCDRDEDLAIKRALDWGARHYYTDYEEMLANDEIDAIEIITPNYLHGRQALAALRAGKHVSVERPIATTIEEADAVLAAADETGLTLQVYEPCLFYKPLLDARNLIDAGEIGTPTNLHINATIGKSLAGVWSFAEDSEKSWRFDPNLSGGSPMLYDIGYQAICIGLFLIGSLEKVETWRSHTKINDRFTLDAPTVAMWKHYGTDCYGTLTYTYAPERKMRTEYHPLELRITIGGTRGEIDVLRSSDPTQLEAPVELRRDARKVYYGQKNSAYEDSFVRATRNFVSSCIGAEEPLLRGNEAKQLLILTLAYQEAAKRGSAVSLQQG